MTLAAGARLGPQQPEGVGVQWELPGACGA